VTIAVRDSRGDTRRLRRHLFASLDQRLFVLVDLQDLEVGCRLLELVSLFVLSGWLSLQPSRYSALAFRPSSQLRR
jgi:hypothetical protein